MQELLDMGLPESVLGPVRKTVLEVEGVEVFKGLSLLFSYGGHSYQLFLITMYTQATPLWNVSFVL